MEHSDFTRVVKGRLGGQFSGVGATITVKETYKGKTERDENGKIIATECEVKTLKHPRLYVWVDDTSKPQNNGFYPVISIEVRNPKITERNAKNISTRCGNAFRKYFNA